MSSRAAQQPRVTTTPLCRIGERVFLSSLEADEQFLGQIAPHAKRHLTISAAARTFQLHLMPVGFEMNIFPDVPDLQSLMEQEALTPAERTGLIKSLFGVAARLFRLQADPVLIAVAASLSEIPDLPQATIALDTIDGYDTAIATIPLRAGFKPSDLLVSLSGDRLALGQILSVHDFLGRENTRQRLAALSFSGNAVDGNYLLAGAAGLVLVAAKVRRYPDAEAFHLEHGRSNPDFTGLYAQADEDAAVTLNRCARRSVPAPVLHEPFLSLQFVLNAAMPLANGLFASGWFHDPENRITQVIAVDHGLEHSDISAVWKLFDGRIEIDGKLRPAKCFVAFLPGTRTGVQPAQIPVHVQLTGGESHLMLAEPAVQDLLSQRDRILGAIAGHAFGTDMLEDVFRPALAPIQQELNARQSVRSVRQFGPRSTQAVSLIIPLYRETGFMRSQLMAFAVDPYIASNCEIVYVLDDPMIAVEVAAILEGSTFAFSLDLKLVTLDRNGGYALANNMAASQASGDVLVLMNSDVIPDRAGWIEPALEKLETLPPFSVIGPKLLYADGSLQHAGMYFHQLSTGFWQNFHHWKGYGRHYAAADVERVVVAVTGACMILHKADFLDVGGFTTDYIVGDYEDSDLCLKLRERKGLPLYMPSIELYHFERQSMPTDSDQQDFGSTIYNRALHTTRWGEQILEANAAVLDTPHAQ